MSDITDGEARAFAKMLSEKPNTCSGVKITDEMIENGCRGMYGPNWDGPADKQPGELMKNVWRKYSRSCLEAALRQS